MATDDKFDATSPLVRRDSQNGIGISLLNLKRVTALITALNGMSGVDSGRD